MQTVDCQDQETCLRGVDNTTRFEVSWSF